MKTIRRVLYPFSLLYAAITAIRNLFFSKNIFTSLSFSTPIIAVGNLSVGGTGKTPQIEYLIRLLSQQSLRLATISRGYKRKSKGMVVADASHTAADLGDEPFQFYTKFPDVTVVASGDRIKAITYLLHQNNCPDVILLDDAMQHRKVKAGFYIMLTAYNDFFYDDLVLPAGNLRESRFGAKRAHCIVVTKCPENLDETAKQKIRAKILRYAPTTPIYFSKITYSNSVYNNSQSILIKELKTNYILLAGIAKPEPFFNKLQTGNILTLKYPDHHNFSAKDIDEIKQKAAGKRIITTEKDYMRLVNQLPAEQLFYLPIQATFMFDEHVYFDEQILNFVGH